MRTLMFYIHTSRSLNNIINNSSYNKIIYVIANNINSNYFFFVLFASFHSLTEIMNTGSVVRGKKNVHVINNIHIFFRIYFDECAMSNIFQNTVLGTTRNSHVLCFFSCFCFLFLCQQILSLCQHTTQHFL